MNKSSQISKSLNLTNLQVHLDFSLPFQMLQEVQCLSHGKFIHNSHENNLASILTSRCHKVTFAINHKLGRLLRKKLCTTYKNWSRPSKINYMVLVLVVSCWFMWFLLFIYFSSCLCEQFHVKHFLIWEFYLKFFVWTRFLITRHHLLWEKPQKLTNSNLVVTFSILNLVRFSNSYYFGESSRNLVLLCDKFNHS